MYIMFQDIFHSFDEIKQLQEGSKSLYSYIYWVQFRIIDTSVIVKDILDTKKIVDKNTYI